MRLIAAIRNPADLTRQAVFYVAARPEDLVDINAVYHGPTEWVVADGDTTLSSGLFLAGVELQPPAMQSDLDRLVAAITEVHPSTVEGLPPDLAAAVQRVRNVIAAPLGRLAFSRVLASLLVELHDAHSALVLPCSGQTIALPTVWLDEGLIVSADAGELRRGDRIMSLAGRDMSALEALLAEVVPAENSYWLHQCAPGLLTDLAILAMLGLPGSAPISARVERDGTQRDVSIPLGAAPAAASGDQPWLRYTIDKEHSLAVFTLDHCKLDDTYVETLCKFFQLVHQQKIRRIAVDLRANSGGNSAVTDEFLRYLDVPGFHNFSCDVRWSPTALQQRSGEGEPRFERAQPVWTENQRVSDPPPFTGDVLVLVGPATFSSGNWFATVVQDNRLGKLVGEPTGNSPSSFGDILSLSLPESASSFTLSFKRFIRPDPNRDPATTLTPDVAVPRTRATLRAGKEPVQDWLRSR